MVRTLNGWLALCLLTLLTGCGFSPVKEPPPKLMCPILPEYLTDPLPAPARSVTDSRDLLDLLADYEFLRRRANADRAVVASQSRQEPADID